MTKLGPVDRSRWLAIPQIGKLYHFPRSTFFHDPSQNCYPEIIGLVAELHEDDSRSFIHLVAKVLVGEEFLYGYLGVYEKATFQHIQHLDEKYWEVTE